MKRTFVSLLIVSLLLYACRKNYDFPDKEACLQQKANPLGHSYTPDSLIPVQYLQKHCGLMPLSRNSYWIYEDSIFDNGIFTEKKLDTLYFTHTYRALNDGLIWWEASMDVGLPELMYSNDSTIFSATYRLFAQDPIRDAIKEYSLFEGDTLKYLTSFEDFAAMGTALKLSEPVITPAGAFQQCLMFEKHAPFYRKDQVYFKPGLGVIKYVTQQAQMGNPSLQLKKISNLVSFHLE